MVELAKEMNDCKERSVCKNKDICSQFKLYLNCPEYAKRQKASTARGSGMIRAHQIVSDPSIIDNLPKYQIIYDQTLVSTASENMNRAINIMAEKGWRCINFVVVSAPARAFGTESYMYALMERQDG